MLIRSIVAGVCLVLAMLSGTRAAGGMGSCPGADCIKPYVFRDTQNNCVQEIRPPQNDCRWVAGLDRRADEIIYGGRIAAYRILWYGNMQWSEWFVPGFNDLDAKFNMYAVKCSVPFPANGLRHTWSYFTDHYHTVVICYSPVKCSKDTSKGPIKGTFPDPSIPGVTTFRRGIFSGLVDLANEAEVAPLRDDARVDVLQDQGQVNAAIDLNEEVAPVDGLRSK